MSSNDILKGTVVIDVVGGVSPAVEGGSDIILEYRPYNYFVNEDKAGSFDGPSVENEDDERAFDNVRTYTLQVDTT